MLRTVKKHLANAEIVPSSSEWEDLRALIFPAALLAMPLVDRASVFFEVEQLVGRDAELWKPLLLLAQVAGRMDIYKDLLSYALEQVSSRKSGDVDAEIEKILRSLHELMGNEESRFILAEEIFEKLAKEDDFSWVGDPKNRTRRGKYINGRLKRLNLWKGQSVLKSIHGEKKRGYMIERSRLMQAAERQGLTFTAAESVTPVPGSLPISSLC